MLPSLALFFLSFTLLLNVKLMSKKSHDELFVPHSGDLLDIQRASYYYFLSQGIREELQLFFPENPYYDFLLCPKEAFSKELFFSPSFFEQKKSGKEIIRSLSFLKATLKSQSIVDPNLLVREKKLVSSFPSHLPSLLLLEKKKEKHEKEQQEKQRQEKKKKKRKANKRKNKKNEGEKKQKKETGKLLRKKASSKKIKGKNKKPQQSSLFSRAKPWQTSKASPFFSSLLPDLDDQTSDYYGIEVRSFFSPENFRFAGPGLSLEHCLKFGATYALSLYVRVDSYPLDLQSLPENLAIRTYYFCGLIPLLTEEGTFLINGCERVVISQIITSPGVLFERTSQGKAKAKLTTNSLTKLDFFLTKFLDRISSQLTYFVLQFREEQIEQLEITKKKDYPPLLFPLEDISEVLERAFTLGFIPEYSLDSHYYYGVLNSFQLPKFSIDTNLKSAAFSRWSPLEVIFLCYELANALVQLTKERKEKKQDEVPNDWSSQAESLEGYQQNSLVLESSPIGIAEEERSVFPWSETSLANSLQFSLGTEVVDFVPGFVVTPFEDGRVELKASQLFFFRWENSGSVEIIRAENGGSQEKGIDTYKIPSEDSVSHLKDENGFPWMYDFPWEEFTEEEYKLCVDLYDIALLFTFYFEELALEKKKQEEAYRKNEIQEETKKRNLDENGIRFSVRKKKALIPAIASLSLGRLGRENLNQKFDLSFPLSFPYITSHDLAGIAEKLFQIEAGNESGDNRDDLKNKSIRASGEQLLHYFLFRKSGNRISTPLESPSWEVDFLQFFVRNPLSQYFDQLNPLSELTHKRRISVYGPGGFERDQRIQEDLRNIRSSYYGKLCLIETPEGENAGLVTSPALFAKRSLSGLLETPYFYVKDRELFLTHSPVFLDPYDELPYKILLSNFLFSEPPTAILPQSLVVKEGENLIPSHSSSVDFAALHPSQILSVATSLVPFIEHNDGNRALMGANMQRQALPCLLSNLPIVGTGIETWPSSTSGAVLRSYTQGIVTYASSSVVEIATKKRQKLSYPLRKYRKSNQFTSLNQRPSVWVGEEVFKGQILADTPSTSAGEISLGNNLLVAYMPWQGYNYEDAIVLNENLVTSDTLTSLHIEDFDTSYDPEVHTLTPDPIFLNMSAAKTRHLNFQGIVRIGSYVRPNDILIGKVSVSESEFSPVRYFFEVLYADQRDRTSLKLEIAKTYRSHSFVVPEATEGRILDIKLSREEKEDDTEADSLTFLSFPKSKSEKFSEFLENLQRSFPLSSTLLVTPLDLNESFQEGALREEKKPSSSGVLSYSDLQGSLSLGEKLKEILVFREIDQFPDTYLENLVKTEEYLLSLRDCTSENINQFFRTSSKNFSPKPLFKKKKINSQGLSEKEILKLKKNLINPSLVRKAITNQKQLLDKNIKEKFFRIQNLEKFQTQEARRINFWYSQAKNSLKLFKISLSKAKDLSEKEKFLQYCQEEQLTRNQLKFKLLEWKENGNFFGVYLSKKLQSKNEKHKAQRRKKKLKKKTNRRLNKNENKLNEKTKRKEKNKAKTRLKTASSYLKEYRLLAKTLRGQKKAALTTKFLHSFRAQLRKIKSLLLQEWSKNGLGKSTFFSFPQSIFFSKGFQEMFSLQQLFSEISRDSFEKKLKKTLKKLKVFLQLGVGPFKGPKKQESIVVKKTLRKKRFSRQVFRMGMMKRKNEEHIMGAKTSLFFSFKLLPSFYFSLYQKLKVAIKLLTIERGLRNKIQCQEKRKKLAKKKTREKKKEKLPTKTKGSHEKKKNRKLPQFASFLFRGQARIRKKSVDANRFHIFETSTKISRVQNFIWETPQAYFLAYDLTTNRFLEKSQIFRSSSFTFRIRVGRSRKIEVGDKLSGRHGNKGVIARIIPSEDMPLLPTGESLDILLNPLGVPSRMNIGQLLEALLGFAGEKLGKRFKIQSFDEAYGQEGSRTLVTKKLQEAAFEQNNSWLFTPDYPGKIFLRDGQTGEYFDNPTTIGNAYILKLIHVVYEKIHARPTGPYNAVTQQPLGGKSMNGGQRFGEMEVWALEAHGCSYTLQELLTIRSDDLDGRVEIATAIMNEWQEKELNRAIKKQQETSEKQINLNFFYQPAYRPTPSISQGYLTLIRELNSLGLDLVFKETTENFQGFWKQEKNLFAHLEKKLRIERYDYELFYEESDEKKAEEERKKKYEEKKKVNDLSKEKSAAPSQKRENLLPDEPQSRKQKSIQKEKEATKKTFLPKTKKERKKTP
jgi:DNA-directed RNA polymerase beta subunit